MHKALTKPRIVASPIAGANLGRAKCAETDAVAATAAGIHTNARVVVVGPAIQLGAVVAHFPGDSQHLFFGVDIKHAGLVAELASGPANVAAALPSGPEEPVRICQEGVALHANL